MKENTLKVLINNGFINLPKYNESFSFTKINNNLIQVEVDSKYNFIDGKNNLIFDQWFDYCKYAKEGFVRVYLNNKHNFVNSKGKLISKIWFDWSENFWNGSALVTINNKKNYIKSNGELVSDIWLDNVR